MLQESPYEPFVRELLESLDESVLKSLSITATNNRITPTDSKEAVDIILIHTQDLGKFFSYRRIKAQDLFLYLHNHKVFTNAHFSKTQLAVAVQQYWMEKINKISLSGKFQKNIEKDEGKPRIIQKLVNEHDSQGAHAVNESRDSTDGENKQLDVRKENILENERTTYQVGEIVRSDHFAKAFCEWFYGMINRLQPVCANQPGDTLRESLFYNNCSVDIYMIGQVNDEKHAQGQSNTYMLLKDMLLQTQLLFSPNLTDGTQAHKSQHGMMKIFSCGTLHQNNSFVGIYEQEFGLVLSPADGTWKIMYTKINLKHSSVETKPPALPPCEVFQIEEIHDSK